MKTVVTLDPEYIPWESDKPIVRLRRRHNKKLQALASFGGLALLIGGALLASSLNKPAKPVTPLVVTVTPVVTPEVTPTPAGRPGYLTIVRDNVTSFFPTKTYTIYDEQTTILSSGDTDAGPVVRVLYPVRVELDHGAFEY